MAELNSPQYWRRSSRCDTNHCLEVAVGPQWDRVYLRNSRDPQVHLQVSEAAWRAFCAAAAAGELDQPATGAG
jgi:Domain of unknown function (DUF397)